MEDYQSNDERRPVSAIRNFYSGVLLLGKQCLINAAPEADPMDVLASKYVPESDGNGGAKLAPVGNNTIDLHEMRQRFKKFGIAWPKGDIDALQKLRNSIEHLHSPEPKETLKEAIANGFPIVDGFFKILGEDPSTTLGAAWEVMLEEQSFFEQQKAACDATLESLPWGGSLSSIGQIECSNCGSSLLHQKDPKNSDPTVMKGQCKACGYEFSAERFVELIVEAEHGVDDYIAAKEGLEPTIYTCPECGVFAYANDAEANRCYFCEHSVSGECARCFTPLNVSDLSPDNESLCSYCGYVSGKD
ncbi:MAG: hypothetical protein DHS20C06_09990 [Hyphobacterium sp.]|nr:MAG: hypothetical protein DHS20C06_09990 [Hyphobacterium sp.]